jgi:hypothetical protein
MARFYANAPVWVTLTLLASCFDPDQVFAASPAGATDAPEKTVPQGTDPAGADLVLTMGTSRPRRSSSIRA